MTRPRRSLLFMPGSNARALEKARTLPADGIILDLEDSVAPDAKATARDQIAKAVVAGGFGKREIIIRINALDSPWWVDDVGMAGKAKPDGILVPKVSSVEDLAVIAGRLGEIKADPSIRVWAMISRKYAGTIRPGSGKNTGLMRTGSVRWMAARVTASLGASAW